MDEQRRLRPWPPRRGRARGRNKRRRRRARLPAATASRFDESAAPAEADGADLAAAARSLAARRGSRQRRRRTCRGRACRSLRARHPRWRACRRTGESMSGATARKPATAEAPRDIADMVVEAAILVDHDDGRLERASARLGNIGLISARPSVCVRGGQARCRQAGRSPRRRAKRRSRRSAASAAAALPASAAISRHEGAAVHAFMREAVVEGDRLLAGFGVHS